MRVRCVTIFCRHFAYDYVDKDSDVRPNHLLQWARGMELMARNCGVDCKDFTGTATQTQLVVVIIYDDEMGYAKTEYILAMSGFKIMLL